MDLAYQFYCLYWVSALSGLLLALKKITNIGHRECTGMNKEALIQNPENPRRHVVLLGAGATRAAFPNGDGNGKRLPLMNDFVETLELATLLKNVDIDSTKNFESIYSNIKDENLRNTLEKQIDKCRMFNF